MTFNRWRFEQEVNNFFSEDPSVPARPPAEVARRAGFRSFLLVEVGPALEFMSTRLTLLEGWVQRLEKSQSNEVLRECLEVMVEANKKLLQLVPEQVANEEIKKLEGGVLLHRLDVEGKLLRSSTDEVRVGLRTRRLLHR